MNKTKIILIVLLGILEIVFVSWAIASHRPHRASELAALAHYQQSPTPENKSQLLKEQQLSNHEVEIRKVLGYALFIGNLGLMIFIAKRNAVQS